MPQLLLLRHAQAAPYAPGATDHQRPLTTRGRRQAEDLGRFLRGETLEPGSATPAGAAQTLGIVDQVLCSSSLRTRETLAGLGLDVPVEFSDALYNASPDEVLAEIAAAQGETLLVIGHSPAIPTLADDLADASSSPELVTSIRARYSPATLAVLQIAQPWHALDHGRLIAVRPSPVS